MTAELKPFTTAHVDYVLQFGGLCRDCADEAGVCPRSGLPCGGQRKSVEWVLHALGYGLTHGFVPALTAPAQVPMSEGPA